MRTANEAWTLVAENTDVVAKAVARAPRIEGIDPQELQSYAYESAFRAAKSWDPARGKLSTYLYAASYNGAIDGLREMGRFYGWLKHGRKFFIDPHPDEDVEFWEEITSEVASDDVISYLSLMELIEPLTEHQRRVAFLTFSERWTGVEIAQYLGVTKDAVSQTRARLVARLRERLDVSV